MSSNISTHSQARKIFQIVSRFCISKVLRSYTVDRTRFNKVTKTFWLIKKLDVLGNSDSAVNGVLPHLPRIEPTVRPKVTLLLGLSS